MNRTRDTSATSPIRRVGRYAAALFSILALAALFASSATARPAHARAKKDVVKPTVVLVHGAWADSGSWDRVIQRLQRDGYTVYAPPNPLQGLKTDTDTIADFLGTISGRIVLVGHSYGGAVITNAAVGDTQVKALVYVDAFLPAQGESLVALTPAGSCFAVQDLRKRPSIS